jgi:hypothetical protein
MINNGNNGNNGIYSPPQKNIDFKRVTCVYILTSKETDFYYEQFLISVTSLRLHSPSAFAVLLIDDKTATTLVGKRTAYKDLIDEIKVLDFPPETNSYYRSRYLKTKMRELIKGDFLYIDIDTVVADDLSEICNLQINIGAVYNCHCEIANNQQNRDWILDLDRLAGFDSAEKTGVYYNGGVIFCKDNAVASEFFQKWHELWLETFAKGINKDQPSLNQANYLMNCVVTPLSGEWNCQIVKQNALNYLPNAKIIHYFNYLGEANIYRLGLPSVHKEIKKTGKLSDKVLEMLKNPKSCFTEDAFATSVKDYMELRRKNIETLGIKGLLIIITQRIFGKLWMRK